MELWVRSQDKMNLVKVNQISLNYSDNTQIIANYTPQFYANAGDYYEFLGTYKSKERALKVLDEIQKYLTPTLNLLDEKIGEKQVCQIGDILTMVYQMPKE